MKRLVIVGLALGLAAAAGAQDIGFIETFSLAPDREVALRELVPGTDDYFYYHALHAQNLGRRDDFRRVMDDWQRERKGKIVPRARELLNRQALLDYDADPKASLEYIRDQLNLTFPHARKTGKRESRSPDALDPAHISFDTFMKRALAADRESVNMVTDAGLEAAAAQPLTPEQRRSLLARLQRPDLPGLVEMIAQDLRHRDSRGFGHHPIHLNLTLEQMDALTRAIPELRNETAFVDAYLKRLAPEDEVDLDTESAAREAYLDHVWVFVKTLDPVHNSLKANALFNRLRHDRQAGVADLARFMDYIRLPRPAPYLRREFLDNVPRGTHMAALDKDFGLIGLPPVGADESLVRDYLLLFLRDAPDTHEFAPFIRDDYLKQLFAETKIVNGVGDPQTWASWLAPEEFRRLKERVDLDFAPDNPILFAPDAEVSLKTLVKNVASLIVKIYDLDTFSIYRETGKPLNLALNLDGLVASSEHRLEFNEAPERRVERRIDLTGKLTGRGAWIVELIGNGKSSRALVQKGRLGVIQDVTAAGHAFTVYDETNRRVTGATAWLAGREFTAGEDGRIRVPFTAQPKNETLIVRHEGFASLVRFGHLAETYTLDAGIYVDRESLLRREKARALIRPVLRVQGKPVSLKLLEDVRLTIRSTDLQGISTEKEFTDLEWSEAAETEVEFLVPEEVVKLILSLRARVRNISRNETQDLESSQVFDLNGANRGPAVQGLHAGLTRDGYHVELRGKNGEPRAGEPVVCTFGHRLFTAQVNTWLKTDANGRIRLGALDGLEWFRARDPAGTERTWTLPEPARSRPAALHGSADGTIRVSLAEAVTSDPAAVASLMEIRGGAIVRDWRDALAIDGGFLELRGLPTGDYSLWLKREAASIPVRVTAGEPLERMILSDRRALELPPLDPLAIAAIEPKADAIVIRLANASPTARVHVFATRYLPDYDVFRLLGRGGDAAPRRQGWTPARTVYESGRDIGDEARYILDRSAAPRFPGNMLERPSLLLNPWAVRDTEARPETLATGGEYAGREMQAAVVEREKKELVTFGGRGGAATDLPSLDFLARPSAVLANLEADEAGVVRIPRADLGGLPFVRVVAVDPISTAVRFVALDDSPVETRELRLAPGLDPDKPFTERKLVTPLAKGGALEIADAAAARFETIDTVAKAFRLLSTLAGENSALQEFAFLARWPDLPDGEKRTLYSKFACHELSFFLYHKDPEFFRSVIAPYLAGKRDKTFMDLWLLGADLAPYLDPWKFGRLNAVERVLLGKRLREQEASIVRDTRDRADLIPPDIEDFNRRFDTALQAGALEEEGEVRAALYDMEKDMKEEAANALGIMDAPKPATAPAPGKRGESMMMSRPAAPPESAVMEANAFAKSKVDRGMSRRIYAVAGVLDESRDERESSRRFFQPLDQTKEWAENNYYKRPIGEQLADLVPVSEFWSDFAAHEGSTPFLSPVFVKATGSFTEILLALAVLELPFTAGEHKESLEGARYRIEAASPLTLFHREIREAKRADGPAGVMVAQNFFRADDRYRHENNEQIEKYVTKEFLPHVVYGANVVLSNPTGSRQKLVALLQIPAGAIPVLGGRETEGTYIELDPYETATTEYHFYFPAAGTYRHYPATLARDDEVVASALPFVFNVVADLSEIDTTSWAWISQNGSGDDAIAFLDKANLHRIDLAEIAWRMRDAAFFRRTVELLESRRVYHDILWSYALMHNDRPSLRTWLSHSPFAERCGLAIRSPLLDLDPVERLTYEHLEYAPLVNPRAHRVGAKQKIHNTHFREQYQRLMAALSYKPELSDADEMAVAYYLALQDRVAEALDWFAKVDRTAVAERIQADYLDVYLAFYRGDLDAARALAAKHAEHPVDRWRARFVLALAHLDEAAGGAARAADADSRDQTLGALASTEPALDLQVEAGTIRIDARNLKQVTLNFYPMDIEMLFSRTPFLRGAAAQFSFVRPALSQTVDLSATGPTLVELPADFRTLNTMVEAVAAGLRVPRAYYSNALKVQAIEPYGQVSVLRAADGHPAAGVYVKVYARRKSGEIKFYKDGYTDLRGRFDYASLNTNELDDVDRFALLILSDDLGAVVREAAPPKK